MSDLVSPITDGIIEKSSSVSEKTAPNNSLGKDAFLQLLVCQMKNQDPLNPSSDTEFVAQLATFSQLEQLQNLDTTMTNTQAFSLIGKDVIMKSTDAGGSTSYYSGTVDFVTVTNGKAFFSIGGKLYEASKLDTVIDNKLMNNLPAVADTKIEYNIADPKDAEVVIGLGNGEYSASKVILKINDKEIDEKFVKLDGDKLKISKEAFEGLEEGKHRITVSFNNSIETTVSNKVTVEVVNKPIEEKPKEEKPEDDTVKEESSADK